MPPPAARVPGAAGGSARGAGGAVAWLRLRPADGEDRLMGFNATRRYRDGKTVDIIILIAAIVVIGVLLGWALFG